MVSSGTSALIKTLLIPPLVALACYVLISYLVFPWYNRYRERRTYSLVPDGLLPESISSRMEAGAATNTVARIVQALSGAMLRAAGSQGYRRGSEGSLQGFGIGDEELEEGVVGQTVQGLQEVPHGRLSRELEGGFMSDSSDEG